MNDRIRQTLEQINALEDELRADLYLKQSQWLCKIKGRRVEFESGISKMHRRLKLGVLRWFMTVRPQNYLTCPDYLRHDRPDCLLSEPGSVSNRLIRMKRL